MKTLADIKHSRNVEEIKEVLASVSIFDKMEFSNITKEQVKEKLHHLETDQVPNRTVLLKADDADIVLYWLKNWIHPKLKHAAPKAPADKRGCSRKVLAIDANMDTIRFYENGQQNFTYTLADIKDWINS
jgi:hypothetical protein